MSDQSKIVTTHEISMHTALASYRALTLVSNNYSYLRGRFILAAAAAAAVVAHSKVILL
jgi:hypothetical protein